MKIEFPRFETPGQARFWKVAAWLFIPSVVLVLLGGPLWVAIYFIGWLAYGMALAVRWALRVDQIDRERGKIDKSLWDDLHDIESKVTEAFKAQKPKPKKRGKGGHRENASGRWMRCIFCNKPTNRGGMYCDDHDTD